MLGFDWVRVLLEDISSRWGTPKPSIWIIHNVDRLCSRYDEAIESLGLWELVDHMIQPSAIAFNVILCGPHYGMWSVSGGPLGSIFRGGAGKEGIRAYIGTPRQRVIAQLIYVACSPSV